MLADQQRRDLRAGYRRAGRIADIAADRAGDLAFKIDDAQSALVPADLVA